LTKNEALYQGNDKPDCAINIALATEGAAGDRQPIGAARCQTIQREPNMTTKIEKLQHKAEVARLKAEIETQKINVATAHGLATRAAAGTFDDFQTANASYVAEVGILIDLRDKLAALTAPAKDA